MAVSLVNCLAERCLFAKTHHALLSKMRLDLWSQHFGSQRNSTRRSLGNDSAFF